MARPFFAKERVSDFDTFDRYTSETLNALERHLTEHKPTNGELSDVAVDIQELMGRFTMDAASAFVSGCVHI